MADALNNFELSGTAYSDAATIRFQFPTYKYFLIIANSAVYYQVLRVPEGMRAEAGQFQPEEFITPGQGSIIKPYLVGGLRFRNAATPTGSVLAASVTARAG